MFFIPRINKVNGRYLSFQMIKPILAEFESLKIREGQSVLGQFIPLYRIGDGQIKILIWSQMHGNESTTTKALLDVLVFFKQSPELLKKCSLYVIPMLNPDGANAYTRVNANGVDLNRDAKDLTQPESQFLRQTFDTVLPDFCFNLHDQRTIFSVGNPPKPATISFLAPSEDFDRTITLTRKKSMEIISGIKSEIQKIIPNQIGRFDDSFNINCTGDFFTSQGVPTLLFEAGHFPEDYEREKTRQVVSQAIFTAIKMICERPILGNFYEEYFSIPENEKLFCDILIKNNINDEGDFGVFYQEILKNGNIIFVPKLEEDINNEIKGHREIYLSEIITAEIYDKEKLKSIIIEYINWHILPNM